MKLTSVCVSELAVPFFLFFFLVPSSQLLVFLFHGPAGPSLLPGIVPWWREIVVVHVELE
jgi:hypothetical protein